VRACGNESDAKGKEEIGKREEGWKVMFWNIAGLWNKDKDFWIELENWDVIILSETWLEEKRWDKIKNLLPRGYVWNTQWATRKNKKGREMGGMIMGIRREIVEGKEERKIKKEGIIEGEVSVRVGKEKWRIIRIYVKENTDEYLKIMKKWMEEKKEGEKVIIGGDFNARTGREKGAREREGNYKSGEKKSRKAKDIKVNKEGKKLVEKIEERGWSI